MAEIVRDLSRRRMLVDALNAPKSTHPAAETHDSHQALLVPSMIGCAAELLRVHALLRMCGAATLIAASRNLDLQMRVRALSSDFRWELTRRIRLVASHFPWKTACLPQSLAIANILHAFGCQAAIHIGVYPYPFSAHAWVESGGEPVNETREELARYCVLGPA